MLTPASHRWLRRLAAVLTVVAAFMFQVRLDGLGSLTAPVVQAPMTHMAGMEMHGGGHHEAAEPQLPQPNHSDHQHSAHCPFCVSNAFALEAGIVGLPQGPPTVQPQPELIRHFHLPQLVLTINARAPPTL